MSNDPRYTPEAIAARDRERDKQERESAISDAQTAQYAAQRQVKRLNALVWMMASDFPKTKRKIEYQEGYLSKALNDSLEAHRKATRDEFALLSSAQKKHYLDAYDDNFKVLYGVASSAYIQGKTLTETYTELGKK